MEVRDFFPDEAALLGTITILWNRQEIALKGCFLNILEPRVKAFGEAIWDRQTTHQNKRGLLSLALDTAELTKRQKGILNWVIDETKVVADRRNDLIHAEYVVHGVTNELHARVKAPRSRKEKHQRLSLRELEKIIDRLDFLIRATEAAQFELLGPQKRADHEKLMRELEGLGRSRGSLRSGSRPPSRRQKRDEG